MPMFSTEDTIVAIATPPGRGGIGVVRVSGSRAHDVARRCVTLDQPFKPRHATLTLMRADGRGAPPSTRTHAVDQVVATFFPAPASYTGEDVVELSAHGSPVVLRMMLEALVHAGARLAEPGEFTLRAFLNGRIDLPQAEAVADLIDAVTPLQARAAFDQLQGTLTSTLREIDAALFDLVARLEASVDFPDEGYHFIAPGEVARHLDDLLIRVSRLLERGREGRMIREGRAVAIVGGPNVGKSSLFNALVGSSRAIVTPIPGTTRDLVSEAIDMSGLRVTLVDTAGVRATTDAVEVEGIARSMAALQVADVAVHVHDGTQPEQDGDDLLQVIEKKTISVTNKCDAEGFSRRPATLAVSAITGEGLVELRRRILESLGSGHYVDCPEITNVRHLSLLERAQEALIAARAAIEDGGGHASEEFILADLQEARTALEEISGKRTSDDVLAHIFERFCIGK